MFHVSADDCVNNWEGQKRQHQGGIQLEPCFAKHRNAMRGVCNVIFNHSVDYSPILYVTFLCASLEAFISVLNIACCAPFEELLCVWRWRWWWWCWGGAVLVAEGHGWEGGYFNFQKGQSSTLLQTHTWLRACRSFPLSVFSFTLKHIEREDSSVQSGCPYPLASCSVRKCLSANDISK